MEATGSPGQVAHHQYKHAITDLNGYLSTPSTQVALENAGRTDDTLSTAVPLCIPRTKGYRSAPVCRAQIGYCMRWHPSRTSLLLARAAGWITSQVRHLSIDRMTIHMGTR